MFQVSKVLLFGLYALMTASYSRGAALGLYGSRSVEPDVSLSGLVPRATAQDFSNSKWIWTSERDSNGYYPVGYRPFRKVFTPPAGKIPVSAEVIITVDNGFTFYVNGVQIGTGNDFFLAERYCVKLEPCENVFAVDAYNAADTPNPAGVLVAIEITYSDGTTDVIVSDSSWRTNTAVPAGFEQPTFNDSAWSTASVEGNYGIPPWNSDIVIPNNPSTEAFDHAYWIWTSDYAGSSTPAGIRTFRKTFTPPPGQIITFASILITTDNEYTLYVNGTEIGSGTDWTIAQRYGVGLYLSSDLDIAVYADNTGAWGAVLVAIQVDMVQPDCNNNCTSSVYLISDGSWKANMAAPTGFQLPGYSDSNWPAATVVATYGSQPWGNINIPSGNSPGSPPLAGAPA